MPTYSVTNFKTLLASAQQVARYIGYPQPTAAAGSTDPAILQMVQALNDAGLELLDTVRFQKYIKEYTVSTAGAGGAEEEGDLPGDYYKHIEHTQWNRSTDLPMPGPLDPSAWQAVTVRTVNGSIGTQWRMRGDKWLIKDPPSTAETISFEYVSQAWINDAGGGSNYSNISDDDTDILELPFRLVCTLAWVKWMEMKGFDSTAATKAYSAAIAPGAGTFNAAPRLRIDGGGSSFNRPIDGNSVPATGYGS